MRRNERDTGFTLIELLVVIAIISMLIGLVSVGLHKTSITAKNLRQKSVFHGMEVGLELFSKDFDGYPDSSRIPQNTDTNIIVGAHHFAEALVGRDGKGFDTATDWYAPDNTGDASNTAEPYTESDASLRRRKALYLEFKHFEARTLDEMYQNPGNLFSQAGSGAVKAPVLTDVFGKVRHVTSGEKIGSPILYFKANRAKKEWEFRTPNPNAPDWQSNMGSNMGYRYWVYNFDDNRPLVELGFANGITSDEYEMHYPDLDPDVDGVQMAGAFYRSITNGPAVSGGTNNTYPYRVFNPNTYILISAGYDGIYGTRDDITNFNY